jgi:RNA ligase
MYLLLIEKFMYTRQSFPKIEHIDDLLQHIKDKKEIRVTTQHNGTRVVCYMVAGEKTFDNEYAIECRGITFDSEGFIICRSLHKFFNVGERETTQSHCLPWDSIFRVMDKRDGSMITPVMIDGKVVCKSKKAFESDVAILATKYLHLPQNASLLAFCKTCLKDKITPIFEWTSSKSRIVVDYGNEDKLVLLHCRDMITGDYLDISAFGKNISCIDEFKLDGKSLLDVTETTEEIEGWVVQFRNGDMVKIKTKWYLDLHHVITFLRARDIAEMVLDETIDDVKAVLIEQGISVDKVRQIESEVIAAIVKIENSVESIYEANKHLDRKNFAIGFKGSEYFGLLMTRYLGQDPDYIGFYKKFHLKEDFSLEQI